RENARWGSPDVQNGRSVRGKSLAPPCFPDGTLIRSRRETFELSWRQRGSRRRRDLVWSIIVAQSRLGHRRVDHSVICESAAEHRTPPKWRIPDHVAHEVSEAVGNDTRLVILDGARHVGVVS